MTSSRGRASERGQAAVEFVVFSVILVLSLMLVVQIAWIGVQKWQFNHYASYSARVWSVETEDDAATSSRDVIVASLIPPHRWPLSWDYVRVMGVWSEDSQDDMEGITYVGVAPLMPLFRNRFSSDTFVDNPIPGEIMDLLPFSLPDFGLVSFMTFVPMEKEPEEHPEVSNRDNDCEDTPCTEGNGRD